MNKISNEVIDKISYFVKRKECFTSLDIYCLLNIRVNNDEYPIYEQVADAYRGGIMGDYLAELVHIPLESGGFANIWRYYYPEAIKRVFRIESASTPLSAEILGHFPLLDINMSLTVADEKLIFEPSESGEFNTGSPFVLPQESIAKAGLYPPFEITVYSSRIVISNVTDVSVL